MSKTGDPTAKLLAMGMAFIVGGGGISGALELWNGGMPVGAFFIGLLTFGVCNTILYYGFRR
jgi:hypothetical protein